MKRDGYLLFFDDVAHAGERVAFTVEAVVARICVFAEAKRFALVERLGTTVMKHK